MTRKVLMEKLAGALSLLVSLAHVCSGGKEGEWEKEQAARPAATRSARHSQWSEVKNAARLFSATARTAAAHSLSRPAERALAQRLIPFINLQRSERRSGAVKGREG